MTASASALIIGGKVCKQSSASACSAAVEGKVQQKICTDLHNTLQ
jgi:hypothetical protein